MENTDFDYKFQKLEELFTTDFKMELSYPTIKRIKESQLLISAFRENDIQEGHFLSPMFYEEEFAISGTHPHLKQGWLFFIGAI